MKKILLLLVLSFVFSAAYTQKFYVGLKGGVNSCTLTGQDTTLYSKKRLPGFHIGALVNMGISDLISLQPELTYSKQGIRLNVINPPMLGNIDNIRYYLNYINLTLLAKAMFGGETIRGFINAGPYIGYMLSAKYLYYDIPFNIDKTSKFDFKISKEINRLDIGGTLGIGLTFRSGPGDLVFDLRYSLGTVSVSEKAPFEKYANSVISGSIGYVVPLGESY